MGKANTGKSRMPRLLSRSLLVLGGAVAGTAAAWMISSASASADTLVDPAPVAAVSAVSSAGQAGQSSPVDQVIGTVTQPVTGSVAAAAVPAGSGQASVVSSTLPATDA
jgi:hypothetical protein